jgi:hypothetical protein
MHRLKFFPELLATPKKLLSSVKDSARIVHSQEFAATLLCLLITSPVRGGGFLLPERTVIHA